MRKSPLIFFLAQLLVACASLSPETRQLVDSRPPGEHVLLENAPFIAQADGDCGPGSLAMVLERNGTAASLPALRNQVYDPEHGGTLPASLMAGARRQGLMSVPVDDFPSLIEEVRQGQPVIVLQNLGFAWLPKWHFAVVVGYDLDRQEMILHSGAEKWKRMPMTHFERHWNLADQWGMVVFPPDQLSPTASEMEHMKSASGLEAAGKLSAAENAYKTILSRWPKNTLALIGLGNIAYAEKDYFLAVRYLREARRLNPHSKVIENNLNVARSMAKAYSH